jgi:hypothetical protein
MRLAFPCALLAAIACAPAAAAAPVALLPDLRESAPYSVGVATASDSGGTQYELVFASGAENVGDGPLSIQGTPNGTLEQMNASQIVTNDDGSTSTRSDVGLLQYVRANHNHFHYLGFEHYELRRASDYGLAGTDHKTGFCFGDSERVLSDADSSQYGFADWCQQNNPGAASVEMGITRGWRDIYLPRLEGQYIYVTGVPPGDYYLVHRINEDGSLAEANYSNDASSVLVRLSWPNGPSRPPGVAVLRSCPGSDRCPAPAPGTGSASDVSTTGAVLHGTIDPNGNQTGYAFEYGPTATYGQSTAQGSAGPAAGPLPVSAAVGGLQPDSTYHFRLDASLSSASFPGSDRSFTTLPLPASDSPLPHGGLPHAGRSFSVRSLRALSGGRVKLRLALPGPGTVAAVATMHTLSARLTRAGFGSRRSSRAGAVTVVIRPARRALAALRHRGRLPVRVSITYRPHSGAARSLRLHFTLLART